MQLVFEDGGRRRECDVQVNNPAATMADLAHALDPTDSDGRPLLIGDDRADPDLTFREAGLHEGAVVRFGPAATNGGARSMSAVARAADPPVYEVVVVNGLDAGRRLALSPGMTIIGRAPGCDLVLRHRTVSKRHAELEVTADGKLKITDLESHNGTWIGADPVTEPTALDTGVRWRLGALELEIRLLDDSDRPFGIDPVRHANAGGTVPFNRPPRPALPAPHSQIALPEPPRKDQTKQPFSLVQVFAPLIFAGGMYYYFKSPIFLMFGLFSPVMIIGNVWAGRRQGKKQAKLERERYRKEMEEFREALEQVADDERRRRITGYPDPAEIMRWATAPSTMLWERRPDHADYLRLRAGLGDTFWEPPLPDRSAGQRPPEELVEAIEKASILPDAPVVADLSDGGVVGIVGDRAAALAVARSLLCQATVLHGPADLPVMVLTTPEGAADWDWAKWLPHTRDPSGASRLLSDNADLSTQLVNAPLRAARARASEHGWSRSESTKQTRGPALLVVVDDESLTQGRKAPTRNLLRGEAGPVAGIVLAETADRLPAMVTTVLRMTDTEGQADGRADVSRPQFGDRADDVLACGVSEDVARGCARALARFEDPELEVVGASLPDSVRLLPLLDLEECTPEAILARWAAGGPDPRPEGPIGVTEDDVFTVDFLTDGPHGLVGGTTGAGKSELLRSMVAGMAATVDPDHLTFLLIDFKGGSAFDECAKLPHTVGMVTDLDDHLAERALRCLEAELKRRERLLRAARATDLPDYLRSGRGSEPMPRLVVIVDEFATLKAELPDFIDALVGVAQRGRSLGVHMLLATQRPQGAISDNIKANTNMRIALRVQDKSDSQDVLDRADAADIPRSTPGRAFVRLGPNEIVAIQTALSTAPRDDGMLAPVEVAPFLYGPWPRQRQAADEAGHRPDEPDSDGSDEETDLSVLVATITTAFEQSGRPAPRRPWPEELPHEVDLDHLLALASARTPGLAGRSAGERPAFVPVALADDPDAQTQYPVGWRPGDGNLLIYGIVGSGTTTVLSSLALALARRHGPEQLHLYALDFGAGELAPLAQLPHCGGVALATERERQQRVIRILNEELDRRRELTGHERAELPMIVTLLDGWGTFTADYQDLAGQELLDVLSRTIADGPEVGIYVLISADRVSGITNRVAATVRQRWAFRLSEAGDYSTVVGLSARNIPAMPPGRALLSENQQLVHVARPRDGLAAAVGLLQDMAGEPARPEHAARPVQSLPRELPWGQLNAPALIGERPWHLPVGLAESTLQPCSLVAYEGEHILVAGPARSGKTTALLTLAHAVLAAVPEAYVAAVASARSPLVADPRLHEVVDPQDLEPLDRIISSDAPVVLVLVDDAETVEDPRLHDLAGNHSPKLLVVAAGRADALRSAYQHWTRTLRRSQLGVLLKPDVDLDGDILGTRLPRRPPVAMTTGRGYVVNNSDPTLAQLALPDDLAG